MDYKTRLDGSAFQKLREAKGFSREKLAEIMYVTSSFIQSWEEGWYIIPPTWGEIDEMAMAYNMEIDDILEILGIEEDDLYDPDEESPDVFDYISSIKRAKHYVENLINKYLQDDRNDVPFVLTSFAGNDFRDKGIQKFIIQNKRSQVAVVDME